MKQQEHLDTILKLSPYIISLEITVLVFSKANIPKSTRARKESPSQVPNELPKQL